MVGVCVCACVCTCACAYVEVCICVFGGGRGLVTSDIPTEKESPMTTVVQYAYANVRMYTLGHEPIQNY